ncbi:MAG: hypothetical protein ACXWGZ_05060 [Candidatus Aminicenantales bacterium]
MGGLFEVVGHSHLGTKRGGLAAGNGASIVRDMRPACPRKSSARSAGTAT